MIYKYVGELIDEKNIYKKAIAKFGDKQLDILQEECAELIQAISKRRRGIEDNIAEEIADVLILIEQTIMLLQCDVQVSRIMVEKLERLKKLVE